MLKSRSDELRRLFISFDYRNLPPFERGLMMIRAREATYAEISEFLHISVSTITRAFKALKVGRTVGQNGRPRYFTQAEEISFIDSVRKAINDGEKLKYSDLTTMVVD